MGLKDIIHKFGLHSWSDWDYVISTSCEQIRRCDYDGISQQRMMHSWSNSKYKLPDSCERIISCCRCKEIKSLGEFHPSSDGAGRYYEQICSRCGSLLDSFMNG